MKKTLLLFFFIPLFSNAQIITTIVGNDTDGFTGDGGPASAAQLYQPDQVVFDHKGNMYIADVYNYCIRKVNTSGIISTYAGVGTQGGSYTGNGGPATAAEMVYPTGIVFDGTGNLYIADPGNNMVYIVDTAGIINTYAGNGTKGYSGDGGAATAAELDYPKYVTVDGSGNVYISDRVNNVIRKVNTSGIISTIVGNGFGAGTGNGGYSGDGGPAKSAELYSPTGVLVDGTGDIYILDGGNNVVRKVNTDGTITTIVGNGTSGYSGDRGPATAAQIGYQAELLSFDSHGNLYIGDDGNNVIRKVTLSSGIISTIAGNGTAGYSGNGGPAIDCKLAYPGGIVFDNIGNGYIPDYYNNCVRKIDTSHPLNILLVNREPSIAIYPNPATIELTIKATSGSATVGGEVISSITISNLLGQVLATPFSAATREEIHIDISGLPDGVYFVKVNNTEVRKFVKE